MDRQNSSTSIYWSVQYQEALHDRDFQATNLRNAIAISHLLIIPSDRQHSTIFIGHHLIRSPNDLIG